MISGSFWNWYCNHYHIHYMNFKKKMATKFTMLKMKLALSQYKAQQLIHRQTGCSCSKYSTVNHITTSGTMMNEPLLSTANHGYHHQQHRLDNKSHVHLALIPVLFSFLKNILY